MSWLGVGDGRSYLGDTKENPEEAEKRLCLGHEEGQQATEGAVGFITTFLTALCGV